MPWLALEAGHQVRWALQRMVPHPGGHPQPRQRQQPCARRGVRGRELTEHVGAVDEGAAVRRV